MSWDGKELQKILNREKVEGIEIDGHRITITTEDKEITIASVSLIHLSIEDREFIE